MRTLAVGAALGWFLWLRAGQEASPPGTNEGDAWRGGERKEKPVQAADATPAEEAPPR